MHLYYFFFLCQTKLTTGYDNGMKGRCRNPPFQTEYALAVTRWLLPTGAPVLLRHGSEFANA